MAESENTRIAPADTTLPPPPAPPDLDVTTLPGFMLDTVRLLGSDLWALSTGDEFKAAVALWCRAWHQVPAGSLPDDDRLLASFAGYGRDLKGWGKVRAMALHGFVPCSDGRFHHPVLTADALQAFQRKQAFQKKRETDAERLRHWRSARSETPNETRADTSLKRVSSRKERDRDKTFTPLSPVTDDVSLVWRNRLAKGTNGPWLTSWGPKPSEPGCEAPPALIAASPWQTVRPETSSSLGRQVA